MSMAIAGPSISANVCDIENARPAVAGPLAPAFAMLCILVCAVSVAGSAQNPPDRDVSLPHREVLAAPVRAASVHAAPRPRRYTEVSYAKPLIRRPDAALLTPQPAPDCEFTRSDVSAVDPNEWARLKIEYERQC